MRVNANTNNKEKKRKKKKKEEAPLESLHLEEFQ